MHWRVSLLSVVLWLAAAAPAVAQVTLEILNGRVTVVATDVTVGHILQEWARVGQTHIENAERIQSAPLSIELRDVPEGQALDLLLRSTGGYVALPRSGTSTGLSLYERILILPSGRAASRVAPAAPATSSRSAPPVSAEAALPAESVDEAVVAPPADELATGGDVVIDRGNAGEMPPQVTSDVPPTPAPPASATRLVVPVPTQAGGMGIPVGASAAPGTIVTPLDSYPARLPAVSYPAPSGPPGP